jgi:signal transduction histidine kinase
MDLNRDDRGKIPFYGSLLFKQTILMVLVLGACVWGAAYLEARREAGQRLRDVTPLAVVTAQSYARGFSVLVQRGQLRGIKDFGWACSANPSIAYTGVYDASGGCLWHSYGTREAGTLDMKPFDQSRKPIVGERRIVGGDVVEVTYPMVDRNGGLLGAVVVGHSYEIADLWTGNARHALIITAVCVFVAGGVTVYLTAKGLYGPIKRLTEKIHAITEGNLDARVTGGMPGDELGVLAQDFNRMVDKLAEARRQIQRYNQTLEQKIAETRRELEATRDRLLQSEKLASLGRLAAGVAHEINNPLTNILGYTQLIEEELAPGEAVDDLQTVQKEVLRCKRIVEDLLMFARRPRPAVRTCDMAGIVDETIALSKKQPQFEKISFRRSYRGETTCDVDPDQFKQVLTALFVNAREAMPDGGTVQVDVTRTNGVLHLAVADTGGGIPEEHIKRIFDPFFTTKDTGTGLGLSVLHGIVEQHRGRVNVRNGSGWGCVFEIEVPTGAAGPGRKGGES